MNKDCNKCEGAGWYEVPNYQHEVMEKIECMDCLVEEMYLENLTTDLAKVLVQISHQRLAQLLANGMISKINSNPNDDLGRIESIIHTKNVLLAEQTALFLL